MISIQSSYLKSSFNAAAIKAVALKLRHGSTGPTKQAFKQIESQVTAVAAPRGLNEKKIPPPEPSKVTDLELALQNTYVTC